MKGEEGKRAIGKNGKFTKKYSLGLHVAFATSHQHFGKTTTQQVISPAAHSVTSAFGFQLHGTPKLIQGISVHCSRHSSCNVRQNAPTKLLNPESRSCTRSTACGNLR